MSDKNIHRTIQIDLQISSKEKLDEMERYHIDPKYRVDLQKYKIH